MKGYLEDLELVGRLRPQDVDREIAFTLLSQAYEFDRCEIDQVVAYIIHAGGLEMGRLVIAPGTANGSQVRIRECHTTLNQPRQGFLPAGDDAAELLRNDSLLDNEFVCLCHHIRQILEPLQETGEFGALDQDDYCPRKSTVVGMLRHANGTTKDSDHYAYPRSKRKQIVQHYRIDRSNGTVRNKDHWARMSYQISGRTLFNYECEFPETKEWDSQPSTIARASLA